MIVVGLYIITHKLVLINANQNIHIYINIHKIKIEIIVYNVKNNKY